MSVESFTTKDQRATFLKELQEWAFRREVEGLKKYGPYEQRKDKRLMSVEGQFEQVDSFNYMRFLKRTYPELAELAGVAQRLTFHAFCILKVLEEKEKELRRKDEGNQ